MPRNATVVLVALLLLGAGPNKSQPPGWQLPRARLPVAIVCPKGLLSAAAIEAGSKAFASPRSLTSAVYPRATVRQLDPGMLTASLEKVSPREQATIKNAQTVQVLELEWPRADTAALGRAYAVAGDAARTCGGLLVDMGSLHAFSGATWKTGRVDAAAAPLIAWKNFSIHLVAMDDGSVMFDTGGLERFGLADLVMARISRSEIQPAMAMLNITIQRLVEGQGPDAHGNVLVRIDELEESPFKKEQLSWIYPNAKRELTVGLRPSPGTGDLRPGTWLVGFPALACKTSDECLYRSIDLLLGSQDGVATVKHDKKLLQARDRARVLLGAYKAKLAKGFPGREYLLVKAPFVYPDGNEWMWVEVKEWEGSVLRGPLRSDPTYVRGLESGQTVEVKEGELFDFMYKMEDGSFFGNETGALMHPEAFVELGGGRRRLRE